MDSQHGGWVEKDSKKFFEKPEARM